jgi:hypothetical protein
MGFKLTTLVVIGFDCIGSCKSNYHAITTAPQVPLETQLSPINKSASNSCKGDNYIFFTFVFSCICLLICQANQEQSKVSGKVKRHNIDSSKQKPVVEYTRGMCNDDKVMSNEDIKMEGNRKIKIFISNFYFSTSTRQLGRVE